MYGNDNGDGNFWGVGSEKYSSSVLGIYTLFLCRYCFGGILGHVHILNIDSEAATIKINCYLKR